MNRTEALKLTKDNPAAADFIQAYVNYCHLLDDIVDKDKPVGEERLVAESMDFLSQVITNPWFNDNKWLLWPLIVTGSNAWLDANKWEREGTSVQKRDADVVKGIYHEVLWFTAYLCGGWEHMRQTKEYREYDHDYKEVV